MQKRTLLAAAMAACALASFNCAQAADAWPAHEIKFVIPFAPGGATDVVFRVISEAAEKELGKPIVPMNMGGAGGSKGSTFVKSQKPDGYTLLGGHEFLMTTKYGGMVDFGLEAFEPVCTLTMTPLTLSAGSHVPYKTYQEMIDFVKANPGKMIITMTPASVGYVFWKQVAEKAGLDVDKSFRTVVINGVGPQTKSILGAHVDATAADVPSHLEYVKDGRIRILAVTHDKRLPQIPDVPTAKEAGYDINLGVTRAIFAPKGTPKEIVDKIADAYKKACSDPAVIKKIEDMGNLMTYMDAAQTAEFFAKQDKVYRDSLLGDKK
jgi:tripartite-type tricarboxylate transporter receptor subunit TctC